ncbi:hypothetical protein [Arthrobacter sp. JSM 101049]|uniref:hypothetical protein n=1 Tax=Arthrobacter sp. JSM 101049 TaxID=929097 RepID=UPI0035676B09
MNDRSTGVAGSPDAPWPGGPLIRPAIWPLLLDAWQRKRLRRSTIRRRRAVVAELASQGWVDAAGRLTDQSIDLLAPAANPTATWRATGRHEGMGSEVVATCGDRQCTVSLGPDAATLRGASGGHSPVPGAELPVAIRRVDNSEMPTLLCAWAGARPDPPQVVSAVELPEPVFTARAHGAAGAAPHEFESAPALWNDDWFVWEVFTRSGSHHGFISTVDHGNFAFGHVTTRGTPAIRLVPIGSGEIWRILEAANHPA